MIYIDTSSFLKLLLPEPFSADVRAAINPESVVVVSLLTELEAGVQIKALHLGGKLSLTRVSRVREGLAGILGRDPFVSRNLAGSVFKTALAQHEISKVHCRSLDRLHLAAMKELGIKRLMTHDLRQAEAAKELGFVVVSPGF
jgi:predicted nucleic acid-binding protein